MAYNGDDEHEVEATEGGQGSGDEAKDGPLNTDDEGDEAEEGHKAEEVNEGTEVEANKGVGNQHPEDVIDARDVEDVPFDDERQDSNGLHSVDDSASTSKASQPSQSSQPCTQEVPQPSSQPTQASQTTSKSTARDQKRRRNVP
ncbi:hypothetical protein DVH24_033880 [Malus domestica]|uniref:Uncharacterized protein n=1 Tax=Malus domestica TaxID=3750 RepID=A0A498KWF3_MALDO|nr:hypothetical protein DVH24_033880 [Malus domestica]